MKTIQKKELMIGLTVLITLLILFFGIDYLKGVNVFKAANYYYASYTNVAYLAQSAPVTVNGYKVALCVRSTMSMTTPAISKWSCRSTVS